MSELLEVAGCLAAAAAVSAALLVSDSRVRAAALLAAMGLAAALVAGQGWDELASLRAHHLEFAGTVIGGLVVLVALAAAMVRWPILLPLLVIATLPFRIRIHVAGGQAVNLLVPLYAVIGAGVLATAFEALRSRAVRLRALPRPLVLSLVLVICLYALQATYSSDLDFAARNIGFFITPFAVLFCLLAMAGWDRRLLRLAIGVFLLEAILFAGIGIGQYATEHIFWNGKLEASNDFHFYFRVNLFWDPNIYGRYLMVAILLACAALLWTSARRVAFLLVGALAIIFVGLVFSFSQTTFASLFVGLAVLAALRWSVGWVAVGASVALAATVLAVFFVAGGSNESSRDISEGHSSLISGGARLAGHRPIYGYGSASFSKEFARAEDVPPGDTTISYTEPITVAAEQGVIGIAGYLALLAAALWTFFSGTASIAPGLRGRFRWLEDGDRAELTPARIGLAAAFVALLAHTIGYAAYLTDPLTWALLAVGGVLAAEMGAGGWPRRTAETEAEAKSAPAPTVA